MPEKTEIGKWAAGMAATGGVALTASSFIEWHRGEDWGPLNEAFAIIFVIAAAIITIANRKAAETSA